MYNSLSAQVLTVECKGRPYHSLNLYPYAVRCSSSHVPTAPPPLACLCLCSNEDAQYIVRQTKLANGVSHVPRDVLHLLLTLFLLSGPDC